MFKPLNNRILVKPHALPNETLSGIMLGDPKEKPVTGTVVVGNDIIKKGDNILFSKFGFNEFEIDKEVYYVVSETNILGIL
jgi:chaperonin GroES